MITAPEVELVPILWPQEPELVAPTPIVGPPPDRTTSWPDAPTHRDLPVLPEIQTPDPISLAGGATFPYPTTLHSDPEATFSNTTPIDGMRPDTDAIAILICPDPAASKVTQRTPEMTSVQV